MNSVLVLAAIVFFCKMFFFSQILTGKTDLSVADQVFIEARDIFCFEGFWKSNVAKKNYRDETEVSEEEEEILEPLPLTAKLIKGLRGRALELTLLRGAKL